MQGTVLTSATLKIVLHQELVSHRHGNIIKLYIKPESLIAFVIARCDGTEVVQKYRSLYTALWLKTFKGKMQLKYIHHISLIEINSNKMKI